MFSKKSQHLALFGVALSMVLGAIIFGGSFLLANNFFIANDPQSGSPSFPLEENTFEWNLNSVDTLKDNIESRVANLSHIIVSSGKLVEVEGGGTIFEPVIKFENELNHAEYTKIIVGKTNTEPWKISVYDDVSEHQLPDGYFSLEESHVTEIIAKFPPNLDMLTEVINNNETIVVGSDMWSLLPLNNYIEINHCYDDSSVITLKILITDRIAHGMLAIGTWEEQNGDIIVSQLAEGDIVHVFDIQHCNHSPFEMYAGNWMSLVKNAIIELVSSE